MVGRITLSSRAQGGEAQGLNARQKCTTDYQCWPKIFAIKVVTSTGLSCPLPNLIQNPHHLRHPGGQKQGLRPLLADVREWRLIQPCSVHDPVLRQVLNNRVDELNLACRRRGTHQELAEQEPCGRLGTAAPGKLAQNIDCCLYPQGAITFFDLSGCRL